VAVVAVFLEELLDVNVHESPGFADFQAVNPSRPRVAVKRIQFDTQGVSDFFCGMKLKFHSASLLAQGLFPFNFLEYPFIPKKRRARIFFVVTSNQTASKS
jgi:hypothetical protein